MGLNDVRLQVRETSAGIFVCVLTIVRKVYLFKKFDSLPVAQTRLLLLHFLFFPLHLGKRTVTKWAKCVVYDCLPSYWQRKGSLWSILSRTKSHVRTFYHKPTFVKRECSTMGILWLNSTLSNWLATTLTNWACEFKNITTQCSAGKTCILVFGDYTDPHPMATTHSVSSSPPPNRTIYPEIPLLADISSQSIDCQEGK